MLRRQFGGQQFCILIFDDGVIFAIDQEDRRAVGRDMFLEREAVPHGFVELSPHAECTPPRATMGIALVAHRDYGIDGTYERRLTVCPVMRGAHHREMTAGGETHHADTRSIHPQGIRMAIDELQCFFDIGQHVRILVAQAEDTISDTIGAYVRHAVFEYEGMNALAVEPLRHLLSFVLHVMPTVTASRAYDDRCARLEGTVRKVRREPLRLRKRGYREA